MSKKACIQCQKIVEEANKVCTACGYHLVFEPNQEKQAKYLRGPSLGALFFTQGWAFGARLYLWFILSLIPFFGFVVLFVLFFFGRRLSWKSGSWASWQDFEQRMALMDKIAIGWILLLVGIYFWTRFS
ncbi:hypothetical protein CO172_03640 [Candidatus Uhrbacteria bacterium CG_4_9_14_3_um_filter_36_7]|uniref:Uncharacterized protein n=1 Tax=Candidatus Uhrbacteria bacterium CG_4_9_14_3_um_filter_36_7 TaxID=1975033 RepID=A0A2M7XFV8_9BACT|nr:MAG: hypothetical protein CO172_03640 [Candidatus Uhrbacteria bacterium CG_4_9_14_3_um_filter_36_7]